MFAKSNAFQRSLMPAVEKVMLIVHCKTLEVCLQLGIFCLRHLKERKNVRVSP